MHRARAKPFLAACGSWPEEVKFVVGLKQPSAWIQAIQVPGLQVAPDRTEIGASQNDF